MLEVYFILAAVIGAIFSHWYAKKLARSYREALIPMDSSQRIINNAHWRRETAIKAALQATKEHLDVEASRLEEEREVVRRIQAKFEQELDKKQSFLDRKANDLNVWESNLTSREGSLGQVHEKINAVEKEEKSVLKEFENHLIVKANINRKELLAQMQEEFLHVEKLHISKTAIEMAETLKIEANRIAKDILNSVTLRYNPKFLWPKLGYNIQASSRAFAEEHFSRGSKLASFLTTENNVELDLIYENTNEMPIIKLSGGSGVEKEILRLTIEELLSRNETNIDKIHDIKEKFTKQLDRLIGKFGDEAQKRLGINDLHPEILKLIGSLNYRTSHRQNQYYHSIEVACLSAMLASELGIDPNTAKRAGFLHDIGKALDYKIEGSHAVISADFAKQHGESQEIVDIILSHHDDKILETSHAFILKAADAMSGARPGARIEMEEGYQKRIDAIQKVISSFNEQGVANSAIMNAGRDVHVFVDSRKVKENDTQFLVSAIVKKLESDVEFPGQIRVTLVRRTEVVEVA